MAAFAEIFIEQGANLSSTVLVTDPFGYTVNLSTYSAASQLRKSYYSSSANSLTATVTNTAIGEITLSMTAVDSANLSPGRYMYDLIVTDRTSNTVTRVVEGIAVVLPSVTR